MELWIRSQDKEKLIKVDRLEIIYNTFNCEPINFLIVNNSVELASFATKERALEVLDEIQNKITKFNLKTDYCCTDNVYEMPKE